MVYSLMPGQEKANPGIRMIAIVNGIAAITHFTFWTFVFFHLPLPWTVDTDVKRVDLSVTYGLGIADMLWSVPFLTIGSLWLQKRKLLGWLAAQMANALYWYSFTLILVRELNAQNIRLGTMLFLPFALFSLWAAWYLWQARAAFWQTDTKGI